MPQQDTSTDTHVQSPAWQHQLDEHWQAMVDSGDPRQAEIGRRMQQRSRKVRQRAAVPRVNDGQKPPWSHVLHLVTGSTHSTWNPAQFKGGHGYAHSSKSGTCVSVDETKGLWFCSSCRTGGTAVTWVMQAEECSYLVAARLLLERYGEPDGH